MKDNDLLSQLLRSAALAEKSAKPRDMELHFALEARILAARRRSGEADEQFLFLPLFRAAFACATVIALLCVVFHYYEMQRTDDYQASLNYTINSAFSK